jgi:hypothetical protein
MSKNNNVNPGQYKVAGRLRNDEDDRKKQDKAVASVAGQELRNESRRGKKEKKRK